VDTVLLLRIYVLVFMEPGTRHPAPGTRHPAPGTRHPAPGTRHPAPGTRHPHFAGITANPDGAWTVQQARDLAMALGERLEEMRFLIRDRGGQFTESFGAVFESCGLRILKSPLQAPRANAICERLVGTPRRELLDRVLMMINQAHLRAVASLLAPPPVEDP
jgi:hypothetical protein